MVVAAPCSSNMFAVRVDRLLAIVHLLGGLSRRQIMSYRILYLKLRAAENVRRGSRRLPPSQVNVVLVPFKRVYHPPNDILQNRTPAVCLDSSMA